MPSRPLRRTQEKSRKRAQTLSRAKRSATQTRMRRVETLNARSDALAERVKELSCLHSITRMLKRGHADLGEILEQIVDSLPSACQFPELAQASITLNTRAYRTSGFQESRRRRSAEIVVDGAPCGALELAYCEDDIDGRVADFLPEEEMLLTTVATAVSEIVALKEAQSKLATYKDHLRSMTAELTMAEERERRSLAISLHDRIGQGLAVAKLKLESLRHTLLPQHYPELDDLTSLIKQIVNDARSLTFDISPPILYELGLEPAVTWLAEHVTRQFGLPVEVRRGDGPVELSEGIRVVLFRSIQELLMNIVKHARASKAAVTLSKQGEHDVCAVVEDDGVGFDVRSKTRHPSAASGFGLFSIRERIGHVGGTVTFESSPGRGTCIRLTVPGAPASRVMSGAVG
jgi:signal transduction histidine kinase